MSRLLCLAWFALAVVPTGFGADDEADDLKALQGTWVVTDATNDGEPIPDEFRETMTLIFDKEKLRFEGPLAAEAGQKPEFPEFRFKIDTKASPRAIDMTALNGPQKDQLVPALYEIKGDVLKLCGPSRPDKDSKRPTSITAEKGSEQILFVLKRKPAK
jgi:uncharacterized protein (TIGR03067 family)